MQFSLSLLLILRVIINELPSTLRENFVLTPGSRDAISQELSRLLKQVETWLCLFTSFLSSLLLKSFNFSESVSFNSFRLILWLLYCYFIVQPTQIQTLTDASLVWRNERQKLYFLRLEESGSYLTTTAISIQNSGSNGCQIFQILKGSLNSIMLWEISL